MKIIYLLLLSTTFINFLTLPDVGSQNVLYHSPKRMERSVGVPITSLNRILIKGKTKLEWQDGHGEVMYAFDIKSTTGTLSLNQSGEVTYQVYSEKVLGRFVLKKSGTIIKISAFLVDQGKPMTVDFEISSYSILD